MTLREILDNKKPKLPFHVKLVATGDVLKLTSSYWSGLYGKKINSDDKKEYLVSWDSPGYELVEVK